MRWSWGVIALVVGGVVDGAAVAQGPAGDQAPRSFPLWEFGTMPRPAFKEVLLGIPVVQEELKLTAAQKKGIEEATRRRFARIQQARREIKDRQKFFEARDAIVKEFQAAILEELEPRQRDRLDQIQLQSQGPLAFNRPGLAQWAWTGPDLAERLKLTDDQVKRVRAIAEEGDKEIEKAAAVPIVLDPKAAKPTLDEIRELVGELLLRGRLRQQGKPTLDSIRKLVETPEFLAAKRKARAAARDAWAAVMRRIEQVLTESQRTAYHELLGAPFDMSKIRFGQSEAAEDAQMVAQALNVGGGGGQQADPDFDTKVARPAYATEHPRVLFDEAHHNFHTAGGRYKPFADLITHDGYKVIPNTEKFTRESLARGDVLIIANALGAEGMGQPGASESAFTDAECDAVRDWVRAGGSLLLITDHAPFGSAAESLAKRVGVDMSKGFTSDPSNSEGGDSMLVFTRKNDLLGDHPITQGRDDSERIRRVQTFTGQSLKGPAGSVAILKLADTAVDEGEDGKSTPAAGRAQGIAFTFGSGRVVVLGEAAELSAQVAGGERFGMNVPGLDNRQMALNLMHWLSGLLEPRGGQHGAAGPGR